MFAKFVLLLFCCTLINAKSLVRRNPRHDIIDGEEDKFGRFPESFKNAIRNAENNLRRLEDDEVVGASPQVQADEENNSVDEAEDYDSSNEETENAEKEDVKEEKDNNVDQKTKTDDVDDEESDEENDDDNEDNEEEDKKNEEETEKKDAENEVVEEVEEEEEEEDESESDEDKKNKETPSEPNNEVERDSSESSDEEDEPQKHTKNTPNFKPSYAAVGAEPQSPKSLDFPTAQFNLFQDALQNPTINKHFNTITNLVDWQTMAKNFLPSMEKFLPNNNLEQSEGNFADMDEETLKQKIDVMERNNANSEDEFTETRQSIPKIEFDLNNLNLDPAVGTFISQAIPENIRNLQIPAKLQGLKNMWMNNVNQHFKAPIQKEPKLGFGGWDRQQKAVFGNLTPYVNKAVEQAQAKLEDNGRVIEANNPPLTINVIPRTPITFKLKRVEGAHTIDKYGQSRAIRYNKLYAFTQYKFDELRYYYDVLIQPLNLFGIRKSITIILNDARTRMNLSVEKDNKMNVLGLEFVNPDVMVDWNTDRFTNYAVNYLINDVHKVIKQKVVEIVSRDSKLLLTNYLKDAQ